MITLLILCVYFCVLCFILGFMPVQWEKRPTLEALGLTPLKLRKKKKFSAVFAGLAAFNRPLCKGAMRKRLIRDLAVARVHLTPEEFLLVKEIGIVLTMFISYPSVSSDMMFGIVNKFGDVRNLITLIGSKNHLCVSNFDATCAATKDSLNLFHVSLMT